MVKVIRIVTYWSLLRYLCSDKLINFYFMAEYLFIFLNPCKVYYHQVLLFSILLYILKITYLLTYSKSVIFEEFISVFQYEISLWLLIFCCINFYIIIIIITILDDALIIYFSSKNCIWVDDRFLKKDLFYYCTCSIKYIVK